MVSFSMLFLPFQGVARPGTAEPVASRPSYSVRKFGATKPKLAHWTTERPTLARHVILWYALVGMTAMLTCPHCQGHTAVEIPTDRCLAMHRCPSCGALITPKAGDCCVVCSYSEARCPVSVRA